MAAPPTALPARYAKFLTALAVAASSTYAVTGVVFYDGPSAGTGDIKWTFSVPAYSRHTSR